MADSAQLEGALNAFISTPTEEKLQALNQAAEIYREHWIEFHARRTAAGDGAGEPDQEATRYKRIIAVDGVQPDGTELVLALQSRTSRREGRTWHVVSWRSRLKPGGQNRRFYLTAGSPWAMPADLALTMFESLKARGGLDARFEDTQRRPDFKVSAVSSSSAEVALAELTMEGEVWGPRAQAIVASDPHEQWRKVMLFDPDTRIVTFRSLTKDKNYMPRTDLRPGCEWFLDNSMQDMNVQQARVFLENLQKLMAAR